MTTERAMEMQLLEIQERAEQRRVDSIKARLNRILTSLDDNQNTGLGVIREVRELTEIIMEIVDA